MTEAQFQLLRSAGCAFGVARWAAEKGFGLLHAAGFGPWIGIPAAVMVLDLVS